ncbi:MAG: DUF559 domain-containing protein [Bacteroidaceae bacterium]|nr:DUF559 domain-containing protein [Bacteroidaceae bacterium]
MKERSHNQPQQGGCRRYLRTNGTAAEAYMWKMIKGRQIEGVRFRRQFSVGSYVIDFYCPEVLLGIELDGDYHFNADGYEHDQIRTRYLQEQHGIRLLRYENKDVFRFPEAIITQIGNVVKELLADKNKFKIEIQEDRPLPPLASQ